MEVNFLGAYKWYYREKKITLTEIYEITAARHNAEDPDYKKILKHRLPAAYREFKDIFSKNKAIPYPRPEIMITKLN